jgi:hypothetical protein
MSAHFLFSVFKANIPIITAIIETKVKHTLISEIAISQGH